MHKIRTAIVLAVVLALAGCQTLDGVTVNGRDVNKELEVAEAQYGDYGWLWVLGAVAAGVLIWVLIDDDDDDDDDDLEINPLD